jgi:hypothetical protein
MQRDPGRVSAIYTAKFDPPGLLCDSISDSLALEQNPFASGIIGSTRYT